MQLVSVSVPLRLVRPAADAAAAPAGGGVAADGAVGQRGRAARHASTPPPNAGGVAADGAVGQRGRAAVVQRPAAAAVDWPVAELPLTVQLVSVAVPHVAQAAAAAVGGVAADGAVGQRGRAAVGQAAAAVGRRSCR